VVAAAVDEGNYLTRRGIYLNMAILRAPYGFRHETREFVGNKREEEAL